MTQRDQIRATMLPTRADLRLDGEGPWFTLRELSDITLINEACVSAQLRHLRACGCVVTKRLRESGRDFHVWEYSLKLGPVDKAQEVGDKHRAYMRTPEWREYRKFDHRKRRGQEARKTAQ